MAKIQPSTFSAPYECATGNSSYPVCRPVILKEFQASDGIPIFDLYLKHISFCMWVASTPCISMSSWFWGTTASNLKNKTPSSWKKFSHYNMFERIYSSCGWLSMRNLFHTGHGEGGDWTFPCESLARGKKIMHCILYKLGEFKMMDHFKNIHYTIYLHKCGCIKSKKKGMHSQLV